MLGREGSQLKAAQSKYETVSSYFTYSVKRGNGIPGRGKNSKNSHSDITVHEDRGARLIEKSNRRWKCHWPGLTYVASVRDRVYGERLTLGAARLATYNQPFPPRKLGLERKRGDHSQQAQGTSRRRDLETHNRAQSSTIAATYQKTLTIQTLKTPDHFRGFCELTLQHAIA